MKLLPVIVAAAIAAVAVCSCSDEHHETITLAADPETFPTMMTTEVSTLISDSGYTRYHITAPLWLMFEEAQEPHWNFPKGIYVRKFDDAMKETGTFTADTAVYFSGKRLWRFDRNVRMRNVDGDRFLTQQLFWDQQKQKVYSDSFIHIERADRIIEGYGFESNQEMTAYTIRKPSGIFPTSDFHSDQQYESAEPTTAPATPVPATNTPAADSKRQATPETLQRQTAGHRHQKINPTN